MAAQILKDPYNFDFLTVTEAAKEREIERGLLTLCATSCWSWAATSPSWAARCR
jgi:hypothetical protein